MAWTAFSKVQEPPKFIHEVKARVATTRARRQYISERNFAKRELAGSLLVYCGLPSNATKTAGFCGGRSSRCLSFGQYIYHPLPSLKSKLRGSLGNQRAAQCNQRKGCLPVVLQFLYCTVSENV